MSEPPHIRITLDIALDADPLEGVMEAGMQPPRAFTGWVALAHALESALAAADRRPVAPAAGGDVTAA